MVGSRIIAGGLLFLIGIALALIYFFVPFRESFILLIYGIPALIIGIVILFNKKEDKIEQIKDQEVKNGKK